MGRQSGFEVEIISFILSHMHGLTLNCLAAHRWPSERCGSTLYMAIKSGSVESSMVCDSTNGCWTSQPDATAVSAGFSPLSAGTLTSLHFCWPSGEWCLCSSGRPSSSPSQTQELRLRPRGVLAVFLSCPSPLTPAFWLLHDSTPESSDGSLAKICPNAAPWIHQAKQCYPQNNR